MEPSLGACLEGLASLMGLPEGATRLGGRGWPALGRVSLGRGWPGGQPGEWQPLIEQCNSAMGLYPWDQPGVSA